MGGYGDYYSYWWYAPEAEASKGLLILDNTDTTTIRGVLCIKLTLKELSYRTKPRILASVQI